MAREQARAGLRSGPSWITAMGQADRISRFYDGCAAEREQAPSPQGLRIGWSNQSMSVRKTCGSELARDGGRTLNTCID